MAEGFAREIGKGVIEPYSAGLSPKGVNERAEQVIKEVMNQFRRVRDEIEKRVKNFIKEVQNG
jgi:protein-tyrosine-phosphatase